MPNLHTNGTPRMTPALVAAGAFADDPVVVVDVGARGGVEWYWQVFGNDVRIIGFEPDAKEAARLNSTGDKNVTYIAAALSSEPGTRTLHVTDHLDSSTFYPKVAEWDDRFCHSGNMQVARAVEIETTTLRKALGGKPADFIKIDAEGAELDIARGADLGPVLGLVAELNFGQSPSRQPSFSDFDQHCRVAGLQLYDIDVHRFSRKALPYPFLYDNRDGAGRPVPGATVQGQVLSSDVLFMRDGLATTQPVKHACLFEIFGLNDCAAEVIESHRPAFARWADPDQLLDLLVPEVKGRKLQRARYIEEHRRLDRLFRPTNGWRMPEARVINYDGIFIPSWLGLGERIYWCWRALTRGL